jgi:hypothetical protein
LEQITHPKAKDTADAELDEIPASDSRAVCVQHVHFRFSD